MFVGFGKLTVEVFDFGVGLIEFSLELDGLCQFGLVKFDHFSFKPGHFILKILNNLMQCTL